MKFQVKRSLWYRGKTGSALVVEETTPTKARKMCCLGFLGVACGVPRGQMLGISYPSWAGAPPECWPEGICTEEIDIAKINDTYPTDDATREGLLTSKFAELGVQVEFVD
jgi:hypothetical protein